MAASDVRAPEEINPDQGVEKPEAGVFAKPVDTYVRPVEAARSQLGQLAGALKEFNPGLDRLEQRFQEREAEQGTAQAEEAFQKDKGDWDAAVKNGDIPSHLNPWGRIAARERFGRMAGDKMGGDIASDQQYIQDNANATTMQQHDDAWASARQRWETTNLGHASHSDPLFQSTFQGMAAAHTQDARNKAVGEIEKNYVTLNGQHLRDELTTHMQQTRAEGGDGVQLQDELNGMLANSNLPELVQRASANAAIDAIARKNEDISVYDLADGIKIKGSDGKEYSMGTDPDMVKLRVAGIGEIVRTKFQATRLFNAELIQKQNGVRNDVLTQVQQAIVANPSTNVDLSAFTKLYQDAGMGSRVKEIPAMVNALRHPPEDTYGETSTIISSIRNPNLQRSDANYITTGTLVHALSDGRINIADYQKAQAMVDKRDKKYGAGGHTPADPTSVSNTFNRWQEQLRNSMSPAAFANTPGILKGDIFSAQNRALHEFVDAYDQYKAQNPSMDTRDLEKFLSETMTQLRNHYLQDSIAAGAKAVNVVNLTGPTPTINVPDESK